MDLTDAATRAALSDRLMERYAGRPVVIGPGILAARTVAFDPATHVMLFMAIDAVKFRRAVTPGDQLMIEVIPLRKGKIFKMKGEIKCDGQVVSSAEFLAGLAEKSKVI